MSLTNNPGRVAGILYLLLLAAPLRLVYIPSKLFVAGNATATANNIAAHETLFRLGIVGDLFTATMAIFLVLALYRLFEGVDQNLGFVNLGVLMVILGGPMTAALYFFNVVNDAAALMLARGADFLSVFDKPQRDALAMLFLRLHNQEVIAAEIFWGLWLIPLAILIYRSGFLPRFLGVWLTINGFAYVALSFVGWLFAQYYAAAFNSAFPALCGELALLLWLVIKGAKPKPLVAPASSAAGG
jgi:hypothetical protein